MSCCQSPDVVSMDFKRGTVIEFVRVVNRICRRCKHHWYGDEGAVAQFTGKQWDAWINDATDFTDADKEPQR